MVASQNMLVLIRLKFAIHLEGVPYTVRRDVIVLRARFCLSTDHFELAAIQVPVDENVSALYTQRVVMNKQLARRMRYDRSENIRRVVAKFHW